MHRKLHIVCLDAPAPPDYGGAIDMYYKIKALAATGRKIILHYFNYNRNRNEGDLEAECEQVFTYHRKNFLSSFSLKIPFIISSRINQQLIRNLNQDDHPVLLEGIHCAGIIPYLINPSRVLVRMHNEESGYYKSLYKAESSVLKKAYYHWESRMLSAYQRTMNKDIKLACLSATDREIFERIYSFNHSYFIPCFIPWQELKGSEGKGNYCLYHGNLAVAENEKAVLWLLKNVFHDLSVPFIIAGNQISERVVAGTIGNPHVRLVNNPSIQALEKLIMNAHIHVLPSANTTGVKLKLLHALYNGRFCITNNEGIKGSAITSGIYTTDNAEEYKKLIISLLKQHFLLEHIKERNNLLSVYDNRKNAEKLNELC